MRRYVKRRQPIKSRRVQKIRSINNLVPPIDWNLSTMDKKVCVVITVMNEEPTLSRVLDQMNQLRLDELIVIVNGSQDRSFQIAREHLYAKVIHYPQALGHDVGRAIGAKLAESDILVFLDGDFPILAKHITPLIHAIDQGNDVALNNITPYLKLYDARDQVTMVKEFLNQVLGRTDLRANSLTAVPHAMSKHALDTIGQSSLSVPPMAQVKAIRAGLKIIAPISVNVFEVNKLRDKLNVGAINPVADLIIGDHLEALHASMLQDGIRLSYHDRIRYREILGRVDV